MFVLRRGRGKRVGWAIGVLCLGLVPALADPLPPKPPPALVQPVTDDYFGTKVVDNYRWMEAEPEPQFRAMLERQNDYARAVFAHIPGRDQLAKDIEAVDGLRTRLATVTIVAGQRFYLKRPAGSEIAKLFVSDATTGRETLLVDPEMLGTGGQHAEIDQFAPSQDGRLIAYGLSVGGSERSTLHFMAVATRKPLPDVIDRAEFANVSWLPDSHGFFYTRLAKLRADAPAADHFAHMHVYLHALGTDPDQDRVVLDADHLPLRFDGPQAFPTIMLTPGSDVAIAMVADGVSPELAISAAPLADVLGGQPKWRPVAVQADGATWATVRGNDVYLLTHKDAPRFRAVMEDLRAPDFAAAKTLIGEGPGVLTNLAAASDALYVVERTGGGVHLWRLPYGAAKPEPIPLPFTGTINAPLEDAGALAADPLAPGAIFGMESWVHALAWLGYDPATHKITDTGLVPKFPRDLSGYDTVETSVRASDGTMIPLSIVYKHGLTLDHSHPALIDGYGSYGISNDPYFEPTVLPWLDRGGVYAVAHVRGGGELGQPWHDAGKIATKQNTITDFIVCAEALVQRGYTSHARLAGEGTSAGGITIGGAITRQPALFRAALIRVGDSNALRGEVTEGGPANVPEFGTVKNPQQFPYLLKMDAMHQVRDGTPYPAVLLTGGFNDPRITVWIPAKMTARLQAATSSGYPVLFRVEFDAGHGIGSTRSQHVAERADEYAFLLWQLGEPGYQF